MKFIDLTGQRFGKLVPVKYMGKNKHSDDLWLCKCDCGKQKTIIGYCLGSGHTKSCGCLRKESKFKHLRCWTKDDDKFLTENYKICGIRKCSEILKRSKLSIYGRCSFLNLSCFSWFDKELDFLKINYSLYGPKFCAYKLNKSYKIVRYKANKLKLKFSPKQGKIIQRLSDNKVLCKCKKHGVVAHYDWPKKSWKSVV